jgi:hypothetical protein
LTLVFVSLGYVLVVLGSWGLAVFAVRFGLATNLDDYEVSPTLFLGMNSKQVWWLSWILIVLGTSVQLAYVWAGPE